MACRTHSPSPRRYASFLFTLSFYLCFLYSVPPFVNVFGLTNGVIHRRRVGSASVFVFTFYLCHCFVAP
jgi:hypothetical protein